MEKILILVGNNITAKRLLLIKELLGKKQKKTSGIKVW